MLPHSTVTRACSSIPIDGPAETRKGEDNTMTITGTERISAVLRGETLDRVPYSFWTHLPHVDLDPVRLAEETYQFYRRFEPDFVKSMPNGMFCVEDFGCECDFSEVFAGGVARISKYAVTEASDWEKLPAPDVGKGALGRELHSLERLTALVRDEAPVVATVFTPLTAARKMAGPALFRHMRENPDGVKAGLEIIARVTAEFAAEAVSRGCAGIFLADQMATREVMTEEEYAEFGAPFALKVLEAVRGRSWFNVLHIHGNDIMYRLLADFPVQAINWHIGETEPDIGEMLRLSPDKVAVGGIRRFDVTSGKLEAIKRQIADAREHGGSRIIVTPNCVIRHPLNEEVLELVRKEILQTVST